MAQLDRAGLCEIAEYTQVFNERLQAGDLSDAEVLTLYLRLEMAEEAVKLPVHVELGARSAAGLAIDICFVDEDLKALRDTTCSGTMISGVWNVANKKDGFTCVNSRNRTVYTHDGVFAKYDDGMDMRLFEEMLAGAGANTGLDLGSTRL